MISLVDDVLIGQIHKHHSQALGEPYEEFSKTDIDARALRITAYLDFVDRQVRGQVEDLQASPFEPGSDITRYYELLPESPAKDAYRTMLAATDPAERERMQQELRALAVPGCIDVNIMTKVDRDLYRGGEKLAPEYSASMAALRGFANSTLNSSVVFSAGMHPRLYAYIAKFDGFFPDEDGQLTKRIVLKVSDYRSAVIQGKFLAKKGIWVTEYRIESGLNCGGHAFASPGFLMGPILEEFRLDRQKLIDSLHPVYNKALVASGRPGLEVPHELRVTVQGGISTPTENEFLLSYYGVDGTGWATPFLLVPEVTNVDDGHIGKLQSASNGEVFLSDSSPFGIPFWNLRTSASEEARRNRVDAGKPGSPCPKGYLVSNTEFTDVPICSAARVYQKKKLDSISNNGSADEQSATLEENVLVKSCICHDLAGGATVKIGIDPGALPAICCGPNIVYFSKIATLEEMLGHIYGQGESLAPADVPHTFIRELRLYVEYLRGEIEAVARGTKDTCAIDPKETVKNLLDGIEYYRNLTAQLLEDERPAFLAELENQRVEVERIREGLVETVA